MFKKEHWETRGRKVEYIVEVVGDFFCNEGEQTKCIQEEWEAFVLQGDTMKIFLKT
jgi:hypothetical protein